MAVRTGAGAGVWAIVVAGGTGVRFGGLKQLSPLGEGGARVLDHAVASARSACDGVVVVLPSDHVDAVAPSLPGVDAVVAGGATRSASVRAGLACVPAEADVVVVHDGARPLAAPALFHAVVAAVRAGADAAIPGVAVTDTVKRVAVSAGGDGTRVVEATIDRAQLVAVQTPQAFRADVLRRVHSGDAAEATDDAALVEAAGGKVVVVDGDRRNLKVTEPDDLVVAAGLLAGAP